MSADIQIREQCIGFILQRCDQYVTTIEGLQKENAELKKAQAEAQEKERDKK